VKAHHAPALESDPEVAKRVERLGCPAEVCRD
jgi:hypothetical protein